MTDRWNLPSPVSREDRRGFLDELGLGDGVDPDEVTLDDVRREVDPDGADRLASIWTDVADEVAGSIDTELVGGQQVELAGAVGTLSASFQWGLPSDREEPRSEYADVAAACEPVYEHLDEVGFFDATADRFPHFDREFLRSSVGTFATSPDLAGLLSGFGHDERGQVDVLAAVLGNVDELDSHHWPDDEIPRESLDYAAALPLITKSTAGGGLLWLNDLDLHLWQKDVLITEEIHGAAVWHAGALATGFYLVSEAAKRVDDASEGLSAAELGSLATTGFAVQAISAGKLPQDVYWITEAMRKPRRAI